MRYILPCASCGQIVACTALRSVLGLERFFANKGSDLMSITLTNGTSDSFGVGYDFFSVGHDFTLSEGPPFAYSPATDFIKGFVNETADDGSADGAYSSLSSLSLTFANGTGRFTIGIDMSSAFFEAHVGTTITFEVVLDSVDPNTNMADGQAIFLFSLPLEPNDPDFHPFNNPELIQNDYLGITRLPLASDQAIAENQAIVAGTTTERVFVDGLLAQVVNTTIPAVAVEGSMYGAVGTSDEITKLVTLFLPAQVANAVHFGLNPQVYACEALGLAFAFGDENGGVAFATNFGPTAPGMSASPAGDAFFAAAAASAIFGSAATANTPGAILGFVSNWEAFFSSHGVPGIPNATVNQIDLAARGAAWGDAVGVALANNLGPLPGQVINFLEDAARGGAIYSKSLASQPSHVPFEGGIPASVANAADQVQLTGIAASDHIVM
jgi:hypothetical protein